MLIVRSLAPQAACWGMVIPEGYQLIRYNYLLSQTVSETTRCIPGPWEDPRDLPDQHRFRQQTACSRLPSFEISNN